MFYKRIKINKKQYLLHRIIMEKYLGRKLNDYEVVHHKDGNKINNDISNLEVKTRKEHTSYHTLGKPNKSVGKLLSSKDIDYIMKMFKNKCRRKYLAKLFNVSLSTIRKVKEGRYRPSDLIL